MSGFKDHFSGHAADYAAFRPHYPQELYAYLASLTPERELAWDCATGNGQAARGLASHFRRVIASDASAEQIAASEAAPGIDYRLAPAEQSGLEPHSVDLITVAQALHWFDLDAFTAEVMRVLKPGGILAVWSYNLLRCDPAIDRIIDRLYGEVLEGYWPPERVMVEQGYQDLALPLEELEAATFAMSDRWVLAQLVGYLSTWSAVKRYQRKEGMDPLAEIELQLRQLWGEAGQGREVRWPLSLRLWRRRN